MIACNFFIGYATDIICRRPDCGRNWHDHFSFDESDAAAPAQPSAPSKKRPSASLSRTRKDTSL